MNIKKEGIFVCKLGIQKEEGNMSHDDKMRAKVTHFEFRTMWTNINSMHERQINYFFATPTYLPSLLVIYWDHANNNVYEETPPHYHFEELPFLGFMKSHTIKIYEEPSPILTYVETPMTYVNKIVVRENYHR